MSATIQENTEEQWKVVRGLLKEALLAAEVPIESKEMYPKSGIALYANANNSVSRAVCFHTKTWQNPNSM
jgi:hypothetical protein